MKPVLKKIYFALRRIFLGLIAAPKKPSVTLPARPRILVIRLDRIGDLVLTTPLFGQLKKRYPDSVLHVLVRPYTADILLHNPCIDKVILYHSFTSALRQLRGSYDLVIDPLMDYTIGSCLLARCSGADYTLGFESEGRGSLFTTPVAQGNGQKHFVEYLDDLLRPLGIVNDGIHALSMYAGEESQNEIAGWREQHGIADGSFLITLHPGGYYPSQRWPQQRFAALIERLLAACPDSAAVLLGSENERELISCIVAAIGEAFRRRVFMQTGERLSLTANLIRHSRLFIGNNSGLLHIAAAVGTPTLSTMGPVVPWLWYPYGDPRKNLVLRTVVPCSPCTKGHCSDHRCLVSITVDDMFEKAQQLLGSV